MDMVIDRLVLGIWTYVSCWHSKYFTNDIIAPSLQNYLQSQTYPYMDLICLNKVSTNTGSRYILEKPICFFTLLSQNRKKHSGQLCTESFSNEVMEWRKYIYAYIYDNSNNHNISYHIQIVFKKCSGSLISTTWVFWKFKCRQR